MLVRLCSIVLVGGLVAGSIGEVLKIAAVGKTVVEYIPIWVRDLCDAALRVAAEDHALATGMNDAVRRDRKCIAVEIADALHPSLLVDQVHKPFGGSELEQRGVVGVCVVVDEAHNTRNRSVHDRSWKSGFLEANMSFLTATPLGGARTKVNHQQVQLFNIKRLEKIQTPPDKLLSPTDRF